MSKTPRTDEIMGDGTWPEGYQDQLEYLARTLELELTAVTAERDALRGEVDLHRWRGPDEQMPLGAFVFAEYTQGTVAGFVNRGEIRSNVKRWKLMDGSMRGKEGT